MAAAIVHSFSRWKFYEILIDYKLHDYIHCIYWLKLSSWQYTQLSTMIRMQHVRRIVLLQARVSCCGRHLTGHVTDETSTSLARQHPQPAPRSNRHVTPATDLNTKIYQPSYSNQLRELFGGNYCSYLMSWTMWRDFTVCDIVKWILVISAPCTIALC